MVVCEIKNNLKIKVNLGKLDEDMGCWNLEYEYYKKKYE